MKLEYWQEVDRSAWIRVLMGKSCASRKYSLDIELTLNIRLHLFCLLYTSEIKQGLLYLKTVLLIIITIFEYSAIKLFEIGKNKII